MTKTHPVRSRFIWLTVLVLLSMLLSLPAQVLAEGSRNLNTNAGKRALTEWRTGTTAGLYRRTFFRVYAKANEKIFLGSSAFGLGTADIVVYREGQVANSQITPAALAAITPDFKCSTVGTGGTRGQLNTRAKELAGPRSPTTGTPAGGYIPCVYTAPETGSYWVAMYGPNGVNGNTDGDAGTIDAPNVTATQNSGVSMFDITVRNAADTATINGRVFVDYLAQITGGNGTSRRINSTIYSVTTEGYVYQVDMRGLDPNGYIFYGNRVGFLDPDGKTPLYHDMVYSNNLLETSEGGTILAPATAKMFFSYPAADLPANILPTPVVPSITNVGFTGSASGNTGYYSVGGEFTYTGNVGGINQIVISWDGVNFDPANPNNRVLYAQAFAGVNTLAWDGKNNAGTPFPVGSNYPYKMTFHAGEYHFPMLDVENSRLGGPTITLLNPIGGTCPLTTCRHAFYDDRGYRVSNGTVVGTVGTVLPGYAWALNPPATAFSNPLTGFDTASSQRAFGNDTGNGFGNWKALDLWTYFPIAPLQGTVNIIPQVGTDLRIVKSHASAFNVGASGGTFTLRVSNSGSAAVGSTTLQVTDTLPASLTYVSASGTGWTCSAAGQTVTCNYGSFNLAVGASLPDISLVVNVGPGAAPSVSNTANLNFADSNSGNNTYTDTAAVNSADLKVTKSVSNASPAELAAVDFTIRVDNLGPSDTSGVVVSDLLPAGLTFVASSPSQGTYDPGTGQWLVGSLPNAAFATLTLSATVSAGTAGSTITNAASMSASSLVDYNNTNNSASAALTVQQTVLTGIVTDAATGTPLAGALVTVVDSAGVTWTYTTGADGRYTITGLAAGEATVTAEKTGYSTYTSDPKPNILSGVTNIYDMKLANADLVLLKTDNKTAAAAGDTLPYVITVTNTGSLAAAGVTVEDTLGPNLTYIVGSCVPNDCTVVGQKITWTLPFPINPLGAVTVELRLLAKVANPLPAGTTSVSNYAVAHTTSPETDVTDNEQSDIDPIVSAPDLKVTIDDSQVQVQAGQSLTYALTYENVGNADASTSVLVVAVPDGLTVTDYGGGTWDAGTRTITWGLGTLAPNAAGAHSFTATVDSGVAPETILTPTAVISYSGTADQDPSNNTASDSDRVVRPMIVLNKSMSGPARLGSPVTVTLNYQNTSSVTAVGLTLTDPLPAGTTYVSCAGGTTCGLIGSTVTWTIGDVPPGGSGTVSFVMNLSAAAGGALTAAPSFGTPGAGGSTVMKSIIGATYLSGIWTNANPVGPANWSANPRSVSFTETGWNATVAAVPETAYWVSASTLAADWVAIQPDLQLDPNYTFFRGKVCVPPNASGLSASLDLAGDDVSDIYLNGAYVGQQIGAGGTANFLPGAAAQGGQNLLAVRLRNNRHGGHPYPPPDAGKDRPGLLFSLNLDWTGTTPFVSAERVIAAGQTVTFTANTAALGGVAPLNYRFEFGEGTPQDYSPDADATHAYATPGTFTARVYVRDFAGCETYEDVSIEVLSTEARLVANTASASYSGSTGGGYTVSSGSALDLPLTDLQLFKNSTPNPGKVGQTLTYNLTVLNNGPRSISELTLVDTLPVGLVSPVFTPSEGSYDPASGLWTGFTPLAGDGSGSLLLTISGMIDPLFSGTLLNTATVSTTQASESVTANNTRTNSNTPTRNADLGVDVTGAANTPENGKATFTITVTNNGSAGVTSFTLADVLPAYVTNPVYTPDLGSYDPATDTWSGVTFLSGDTLVLTVVADVQPGFPGTLIYTVNVNTPPGTLDSVASNNTDSVTLYHDPTAVTLQEFSAQAETFWQKFLRFLGLD